MIGRLILSALAVLVVVAAALWLDPGAWVTAGAVLALALWVNPEME